MAAATTPDPRASTVVAVSRLDTSLGSWACENKLDKTMLAWMPISADTSAGSTSAKSTSPRFATCFVGQLARVASVVRAMLREIFDESAYDRFLTRNRVQSSPDAYAAFRQENDQSKSRRPRCC